MNILTLKLDPIYFSMIREGRKTIEARIYSERFNGLKIGAQVLFVDSADERKETLSCRIKRIDRYSTFREMLTVKGYERALPNAKNIDEATKQYLLFPGYNEKEKTCGVIALEIEGILS